MKRTRTVCNGACERDFVVNSKIISEVRLDPASPVANASRTGAVPLKNCVRTKSQAMWKNCLSNVRQLVATTDAEFALHICNGNRCSCECWLLTKPNRW